MLSEVAVSDPAAFGKIVEVARQGLARGAAAGA
jgi:ribosomal protein L20